MNVEKVVVYSLALAMVSLSVASSVVKIMKDLDQMTNPEKYKVMRK